MNLFLVGMLLMTVMYAAPQPPAPDVSVVAIPTHAQPTEHFTFSVALHRDDGTTGDADVWVTTTGMHIERITPNSGTCDTTTHCVVPVAKDAPAIIWVEGSFLNDCTPRATLTTAVRDPWPPVIPPPYPTFATVTNDAPVCRVYLPLASHEG